MLCQRISQNSRTTCGFIRFISTSGRSCANHYDVLGLTPKATQTDIKTAYYALSKIYHPDKSSDEASAKQFRAITEAYEVLGNVKTKKLYDKGLIVGRVNKSRMDYQPDPEPTDPNLKFYKSRMKRQQVTPFNDGSTIYDFDAWAKNHYGASFKRSKYERETAAIFIQKRKTVRESQRQDVVLFVIFLLGVTFIFIVVGQSDYDKVVTSTNKDKKPSD
ncbi:hypothetical protein ACJJTC_001515 [Scirpophaga incertulas]